MTMRNILTSVVVLLMAIIATASASVSITPPGGPMGDTGWYVYQESSAFGTVQMFQFFIDDDNIVIELDKEFTGGFDEWGIGDSIILRFSVADPSAVNFRPNIMIRDERVINRTGVEWFDFHIALGVKVPGPNDPTTQKWGFDPDYIFAPSVDNPFENISFEAENLWQGTAYGSYATTPMKLDMFDQDGQGLPDDGEYYIFGGSQSGHLRIVTSNMAAGDYFILKEWPTVPEPATLSLLALGAMSLLRRKHN